MSSSAALQNRPYRSHRVPACTRCRSRKIRCHIDIPGEPCLSCREKRLKCQYIDNPKTSNSPTDEEGERRSQKRPRLGNGDDGEDVGRSVSAPTLHKPGTNPSASIMLAPHVAEDIDFLRRHISRHQAPEDENPSQHYQTLTRDNRNPIVYLSVPRYRSGLQPLIGAGKEQLEIIEQIIGPFKEEVIELFFQHTHPHFPVLDTETCALIRQCPREKVPRNLMCVIYALSAPNWGKSDTLKLHPRPDSHYVWNKTISAVIEDFLSPSLATVAASVLDQIGRPSVSIVGNSTNCARTVSLAQAFGLHRDPSKWEISDEEKSTRIRLWWGVLITDYWASIAYGAPPHVRKGFYDVGIPTLELLLPSKTTMSQQYASTCFIHLCAVTELLGDILPLLHHIGPDPEVFSQDIEKLKVVLNDLESKLPKWLPLPDRPGSSNLWFCFLSMRLLLCRVALRAAVLLNNAELERSRLDELRICSSDVLDFILILGESQFLDFWLPYTTYLLVLAMMVSLRCNVEAQNPEVRKEAIERLQRVLEHIQNAHDNYDWDIAKYCLERCSGPVAEVAALAKKEKELQLQQRAYAPPEAVEERGLGNGEMGVDMQVSGAGEGSAALTGFEDPAFLLSDFLDPNAFDFSWEALWDTPSGVANFTV